jgi:signal transduction histidine kinase
MATTAQERLNDGSPRGRMPWVSVFHWSITILAITLLMERLVVGDATGSEAADLVAWVVAALLADLMTVQMGRGVVLSMSVPVLLAAAMLHAPAVAALIGFLGCLDVGELRGRIGFERALFNRAQIALAVASSSFVMTEIGVSLEFPGVLLLAAAGLVGDCTVNVALVTVSTSLSGRGSIRETLTGLSGVEPLQSVALYGCMCLVAPLLALIYVSWGATALVLFSLLVLPFRLTLVKMQQVGEIAVVARLREAALERAQKAADAERVEERQILAGDLHDEVLPPLYQVHLMGEVLRQDLAQGRLLDLDEDLPALLEATNVAQHAVRRYVKGLRLEHRGIRDIAGAIRACADEAHSMEGSPRIELRLEAVHGSERAVRTLVQVAREAIVNGARYSSASIIRVELMARDGVAELAISDDGVGFDAQSVDRSEHFGLQFMKERVESAGGRLTLTSSLGQGTFVSALVPLKARSADSS